MWAINRQYIHTGANKLLDASARTPTEIFSKKYSETGVECTVGWVWPEACLEGCGRAFVSVSGPSLLLYLTSCRESSWCGKKDSEWKQTTSRVNYPRSAGLNVKRLVLELGLKSGIGPLEAMGLFLD